MDDVAVPPTVFAILTVFSIVFCVLGIVFNILVLAVVQQNRSMQTSTNYLLANVALADLITLAWPFNLRFFVGPKMNKATGDFLCKFIRSFPFVTMSTASFTLALLAVERYQGLVKPMSQSRLQLTKRTVLYAIAVAWTAALTLFIPFLVYLDFNKEDMKCRSNFTSTSAMVVIVCHMTLTVLVPCVTISFCYFKIVKGIYFTKTILAAGTSTAQEEDASMKKKLVRTLVLVTAIFIVCHVPYTLLFMMLISGSQVSELLRVTIFVVYGNSMLNPVLYAFPSSNYKDGIKHLCRCRTRRRQINNAPRARNTGSNV